MDTRFWMEWRRDLLVIGSNGSDEDESWLSSNCNVWDRCTFTGAFIAALNGWDWNAIFVKRICSFIPIDLSELVNGNALPCFPIKTNARKNNRAYIKHGIVGDIRTSTKNEESRLFIGFPWLIQQPLAISSTWILSACINSARGEGNNLQLRTTCVTFTSTIPLTKKILRESGTVRPSREKKCSPRVWLYY